MVDFANASSLMNRTFLRDFGTWLWIKGCRPKTPPFVAGLFALFLSFCGVNPVNPFFCDLPLRPRQIQMISLRLEAEILDCGGIEAFIAQSDAKKMNMVSNMQKCTNMC